MQNHCKKNLAELTVQSRLQLSPRLLFLMWQRSWW